MGAGQPDLIERQVPPAAVFFVHTVVPNIQVQCPTAPLAAEVSVHPLLGAFTGVGVGVTVGVTVGAGAVQ